MPRRSQRRRAAACAGLILLAASAPQGALAQLRVRIRSSTTAQLIQLRPYQFDSTTNQWESRSRETAAPLVQDVAASAWGFGVPGLRLSALLRLRASAGSDFVWPRSNDHVDALWAFAELDRAAWRVRLGRIQRPSPLVIATFDGASVLWRPRPWVRAEAYGGRSLVRALSEPATSSAIASVDPFVPSEGVVIGGLAAWAEPTHSTAFSLAWQRETTSSFGALVSDHAAMSARWEVRHIALSGSADYDITGRAWGRARLSALIQPRAGVSAEAALFRYRPIFPLNTIWGAFSPQGHWGASASAEAQLGERLSITGSYTMRRYRPTTETTPFLPALGDVTHNVGLGAAWRRGAWHARGGYRLNLGYGGEHSGFDVAGGLARERWQLEAQVVAFEESEELRVAGGTVYGLGGAGRFTISDHAGLRWQIMQYRHRGTRGAGAPDWSQLRALAGFDLVFGANADRWARP